MARRKKVEASSGSLNMTSMIDIVFQLIIFFLLVNNIVSEESVQMYVPKLYEPQAKDLGDVTRVIINVVPSENPDKRKEMSDILKVNGAASSVSMWGRVYGFENLAEVTKQLEERRLSAELKNEDLQVLVRADAATFYQNVQPVLAAITSAGIKTVNLVTYLPDEGPENLPWK